jgi:transposase
MAVASPMAKRAAFLQALGKGATVAKAAKLAGVSEGTLYKWREDDETFDADWAHLIQVRKALLADKGLRAVEDIIDDPKHKDRFAASKWAAERVEGAVVQTQQVAGRIEHELGTTFADLLDQFRIERPKPAPALAVSRPALPPAGEVLAETENSVDSAGRVPA